MEKKYTILIADDEKSVRKVTSELLKVTGNYKKIFTAANLEEATTLCENVDLILIDYGMGAEEIFKKVQEINPTIKGIVFSGSNLENLEDYHLRHGFHGYTSKPLKYDTINSLIMNILEENSLQQQQ